MSRSALFLVMLAPLSVAHADEVAAVLLLQGDVTIDSGGSARAAEPGMGLMRSDIVTTGEESAVVLHLHNNHLVRLDEDLELEVGDIVMLDAPSIDPDVEGQLSSLLYPGEREDMEGSDQASRVAGWQSRLSAGVSVGSQEETTRYRTRGGDMSEAYEVEDEEEEGESFDMADDLDDDEWGDGDDEWGGADGASLDSLSGMGPGGGGSGPSDGISASRNYSSEVVESDPAPSPPPAPTRDAKSEKKEEDASRNDVAPSGDSAESYDEPIAAMPVMESAKNRGGGSSKKDKKKRKSGGKNKADSAEAGPMAQSEVMSAHDLLAIELSEESALHQCLVDWGKSLPVAVDAVQLSLRLDGAGQVQRVRMNQGLTEPPCARDMLVGRVFSVDESALVFDVLLKD